MLCIVFAGLAIVCAVEWLLSRISIMTLLWYLQEKNYPLPTGEELKEGTQYAVKHIITDLFGAKR